VAVGGEISSQLLFGQVVQFFDWVPFEELLECLGAQTAVFCGNCSNQLLVHVAPNGLRDSLPALLPLSFGRDLADTKCPFFSFYSVVFQDHVVVVFGSDT
jgi:hypothetical protein